jgi:hypothetical protein
MRWILWSVLGGLGACGWGVDDDAVLFCVDDGDCPDAQRCAPDHLCRPASVDITPPLLLAARFEPEATPRAGAVALIIQANKALDAVDGVGVEAPGLSLDAPELVDAQTRRFAIDPAGLDEGFYVVRAVTLRDAVGIEQTIPLALALEVDDTPPEITGLGLVDPPLDGRYADVGDADRREVVVSFRSNDTLDLGRTRIAVAERDGACVPAATGSLVVVCRLPIDAGSPDGAEVPLVVRAVDRAGNETATNLPVHLDTRGPALVDLQIRYALPGLAAGLEAAVPGSTVIAELISDEPLAAPPTATVEVGGRTLPMQVSGDGVRFELRLDVAGDEGVGDNALVLFLQDIVGHNTSLRFDNPITFAPAVVASCPQDEIACPDFDGDGVSPDVRCSDPPDCHDLDPTVGPGFPEIPGDGVANACGGVERAPRDVVGAVFVDPARGAGGTGSADDPFGSLDAALRAGSPDAVFVAGGGPVATVTAGALLPRTLIGGLEAGSWQRSLSTTTIELDESQVDLRSDCAWARLRFTSDADLRVAARCSLVEIATERPMAVSADARLVRVEVPNVSIGPTVLDGRVIESRLGSLTVNGAANLHRVEVRGRTTVSLGRLVATSSVFDTFASGAPGISVANGARLELFHSAVYIASGSTPPSAAIEARDPDVAILVYSSNVFAFGSFPLVQFRDQAPSLLGNALGHFNGDGPLLRRLSNGLADTAAELNDLGPQNCDCGGNVDSVPTLAPGDRSHVARSSGTVDAVVVPLRSDMPGAILADFDGECRTDDAARDIGNDEVR